MQFEARLHISTHMVSHVRNPWPCSLCGRVGGDTHTHLKPHLINYITRLTRPSQFFLCTLKNMRRPGYKAILSPHTNRLACYMLCKHDISLHRPGLPNFSCVHWKTWEGLGTRLSSPHTLTNRLACYMLCKHDISLHRPGLPNFSCVRWKTWEGPGTRLSSPTH